MTGQANFHVPDEYDETEALSSRRPSPTFVRLDLEAEIRAAHQARIDRRIDIALQIAIATLTTLAIGLLTSGTEYARWGHIAGLVSQPFYIVASWRARQWGMFAVAVALCGLWLRGIANSFPLF